MSVGRSNASPKNWLVRHKMLSGVVGLLLVMPIVTQCSTQDRNTSAPATTVSAPASAPHSTPSVSTGNASTSTEDKAAAAKKSAQAKKREAAAKRAAAAKKAAAKRAAAKKAAAKKAAAKRAAAKRAAEKRAAAKRAAQQREDARNTFANCTDMNEVYPHGVGRPGARDHSSGTPVTNFKVSQHIYNLNSGSDRDGDGIACEDL